MTDQEETINFVPPAVWTIRHWDLFVSARSAYVEAHKDGSKSHADYVGSLALIKDGVVHVEASDAVKALLVDRDDIPLPIMGLVTREIAAKLESALNDPFQPATS